MEKIQLKKAIPLIIILAFGIFIVPFWSGYLSPMMIHPGQPMEVALMILALVGICGVLSFVLSKTGSFDDKE